MIKTPLTCRCAMLACLCAQPAHAQSLLLREPDQAPLPPREEPATVLYGASIMAVRPPEPREYAKHDLVTIIIDELSRQESEQSLETEKDFNLDSRLNSIIDPWELLELRLREANATPLDLADVDHQAEFEAEGTFERTDRFQARITAEIIDVKPNGTLTLEARSLVETGGESLTLVLSGVCRPDDITNANTVLSSQLANKTLLTRMEGELKRSTKKGVIARALETLFAF